MSKAKITSWGAYNVGDEVFYHDLNNGKTYGSQIRGFKEVQITHYPSGHIENRIEVRLLFQEFCFVEDLLGKCKPQLKFRLVIDGVDYGKNFNSVAQAIRYAAGTIRQSAERIPKLCEIQGNDGKSYYRGSVKRDKRTKWEMVKAASSGN